MKKALLSLSILTATLLFVGCENETIPPVEIQSTPESTIVVPEVAPGIEENTVNSANTLPVFTGDNNEFITSDSAKQIALEHAQITESEANFVKVEFDYDNGTPEYEVEFYVGDVEYDYEINAITGDIISIDQEIESSRPTTSTTANATANAETNSTANATTNATANATANTSSSSTQITEAEAKSIALNHAGVSESEVTFAKVKLEYDDGILEYEVEFYVGNMEYDYEINAITGDIISVDQEMESLRPTTSNTTNTTSNTNNTSSSSTQITEAEAKTIALNHAGVSESDVTFAKVKLDYDDGILEYEVEFYVGNMEYDYEINATTGAIIGFDQDMESSRPSTSTNSATITETEAKTIALNHAGLTESGVSSLKVKLDYDDGVAEYEVEFRVGNVEYDYEINATTGAIIGFDKDND